MNALHLEELNAGNVAAANTLSLKPGQDQFVAPVSHSIAEAYVNQESTWPRVAVDGDTVVGFLMGNFDEDAENELFRATILRMNVDGDHQRQGVGTFLVNALADEARSRGIDEITAGWEEGELGPGQFFRHLGFVEVGETEYGETIGKLTVQVHAQ